LYLLISAHGVKGAIAHIVLCATVQLVVGFPFLAYHPWSYIAGSFNLGRVFMHRWSVNLKFLPEEVFTSRWLAMLLLLAHASFLVIFYLRHLGHNSSWLSRWRTDTSPPSP
jgi:alpha-1,3-mannosyltransferase